MDLTMTEYQEVVELAESRHVTSMLGAPDFDAAADNEQGPEAAKKPEPRKRQASPVMETTEDKPVERPAKTVKVDHPGFHDTPEGKVYVSPSGDVKGPQEAKKSSVITLPTGEMFDTETGEYIERSQPKVDLPERDPDTIELPDGRFFNKKLNAFVTGPQVGAKEKVEDAVPERPKRSRGRPKKEAAAPPPAEEPAAESG